MGKSKGKKTLSILGFAVGYFHPQWFQLASSHAFMAGLYGASLGGTLWNIMHPPKMQMDYGRFDSIMNTVSSEAVIPVIYGIRKWGGIQTWHKTENNNKRIIKDIIICEGEIDGIYDVRANDIKIGSKDARETLEAQIAQYIFPSVNDRNKWLDQVIKEQNDNYVDNCSFVFKNGSPNQSPPDNWDVVGGYKNCAWLRATLNLSEKLQGGNPTITMLVKGKKVWVWRNGSWYYEWSNNPAWCLRDFLLSKRYGLGQYITQDMIDEDSFKEAADYCDELVYFYDANGQLCYEKRFTLNMIIDQQREASEVLGEILSNFGGFLVITDDKISLRIEKDTPSSYIFNDDTIIRDSMEITQVPLSETPNRYRIGYFDPLQNWTQVKIMVEDTADQKERGIVINKDITLSGVLNQSQALRLSRFYRDLNKVCNIVIQFQTATQAMHLEPGDVITVSWNNVFQNMPFRILEIYDNGQGVWTIKAQQFNPSIYNDALGAEITIPNYTTIPSPISDVVPEASNIQLEEVYYIQKTGEVVSYIRGTVDLPKYQFFREAIIEYSEDGNNWNYLGTTKDGNFIIPNIKIGATYYVRIKIENSVGRRSNGIVSDPIVTQGKNKPPANVTNFNAQPMSNGFLLTWDSVPDPDLDGYNIYQGKDGATIINSVLIAERLYSTSLFVPVKETGVYTFHIVAIDTSGNKSEIPATINISFNAPPDVQGFDIVVSGSELDFRWQAINQPNIRYEIRRGEGWEYGEFVGKTANNFFKYLFPASGSHTFWIKAIDAYGNYSENPTKAEIVTLPKNDRNILATFNQVQRGWEGAKINTSVVDGGLKLNANTIRGEHIVEVNLSKPFLARNWIISHMTGIQEDSLTWGSANFSWNSHEAQVTRWKASADISGATLKHQIAYWKGIPQNIIESIPLDESPNGEKNNITPAENQKITYADGRFRKGAVITDLARLSYNISIPSTFYTVFNVKITNKLNEHIVYVTLKGNSGKLFIGYDAYKQCFYMQDHLGNRVEASIAYMANDFITIGIAQNLTKRKLFLYSFSTDTYVYTERDLAPIGAFTQVFLYPKLN